MFFFNPSNPLKDIILDKSKIDKEKASVKVTSLQKHVQDYDSLICIRVNCRLDKDILLYKEITEENSDKKILKNKGPVWLLTFT